LKLEIMKAKLSFTSHCPFRAYLNLSGKLGGFFFALTLLGGLNVTALYAQTIIPGTTATWKITGTSGDYTLTLSGNGPTGSSSYSASSRPPWESYKGSIKTLVINEGITTIVDYTFYNYTNLTKIITHNPIPPSASYDYTFANVMCLADRELCIAARGLATPSLKVFPPLRPVPALQDKLQERM
jgi:hypothetical protein